ncbi:phosphate ABC transporter substrate-binding/OmpA family protein [Aestuariivita boseongensis]|uniref:phosphate ABC transporter substrate-binding/OmpA family protein n=1 Tax=Aestuariivita boseongensis TaxID=1470562 RepID=UPI000681748D|nr:phosphate ABC transporter substrate-binding/OmpA family protein [Aestuariivita boseongensis]
MLGSKGAAIFAALLLLITPLAATAQDVTLTSRDGGVEITGTLLGFDGEFYRVDTVYGELTVDGSGVTCEGPGCPNLLDFVAEVDFSGSSTMAEVLMPALLEGFALRNGYRVRRSNLDETHVDFFLSDGQTQKTLARFGFRVTTTDEGFADLLADEADIVLALREIRPEERTRAREAGMGDMTDRNRSRVLALDAMVPIVSPGNPVKAISMPDLAAAFSGKITNWADLGGPDAPITLHLPDAGSGLAQAVEDRLLRPVGAVLPDDVVRHRVSSALSRAVTTDPFGLGLVSFAEVGNARMLTLTGSCGFTLEATRRTIKTEDYPLTSPMFLYMPARRLPKLAREFLGYLRGPAAQIVIRRVGFVDQAPEEIPINRQGDRFANAISSAGEEVTLDEIQRMVSTLRPMTRLTTSFRFETGSTRLDAQSRSNVEQLARAIEAGVYDARSLSFVGFSDGEGPAPANLEIARRRATAVRDAVTAAAEAVTPGRVELKIEAYGEAMPMACDDSAWGRQVNRRVEVWVK